MKTWLGRLKNFGEQEEGQTAIEYVLLLVVVIAMIYTLGGRLKIFMLGDKGNCTDSSKSIVCSFERRFTQEGFRTWKVN
ncbi:MAG: hypothetical protein HN509_14280 [Halobacteriovoraceae bacterium]|jgi:Flp pilus assembly pilin Flp|nr:hypothetical protein [Halobacteriovoraceae bacterium]MBT5095842.1 hypothetical protein [Halobacteriovoraceae bacterium]